MRFVDRKSVPRPEVFSSKAFDRVRYEVGEWRRAAPDLRDQLRVSVNWKLLHHPEITSALGELFAGRCAFCEDVCQDRVKHLRPSEAAEARDGVTSHLHYGWLIYEWENLLPICDRCDRAKRNRFWVQGKRAPFGTPIKKLRAMERPLLLDPTLDRKVAKGELTFAPNGRAKPLGPRGHATIELVALNRPALVASRSKAFTPWVRALRDFRQTAPRVQQAETKVRFDSTKLLLPVDQPFVGATCMMIRTIAGKLGERTGNPIRTIGGLMQQFQRLDKRGVRRKVADAILIAMDGLPEDAPSVVESKRRPKKRARARPSQSLPKRAAKRPSRSRTKRQTARPSRFRPAGGMDHAHVPIASIEIRNFRVIEHLRLELPERVEMESRATAMMLLGENATGKSTVIEAVALALLGTREIAAMGLRPGDFLRLEDPVNRDSVAGELSVELEFFGDVPPVRLTADVDPNARKFGGTETASKVLLAYGPRRFFPREQRRRFRTPAQRVESLLDPMSVIQNPRYWLQSRKKREFNALARALRDMLPTGLAERIETDGKEVWILSNGRRDPIDKLSAGYATVMAMVVDIMREMLAHFDNLERAYGVVIIDEIETHLHPQWKMRVVQALRKALPQVQFLVTTHDPLCLKGMHDGEVFVLRRNVDRQRVESVPDLPGVTGMRAEQLLTSEFFGLGSTDPETEVQLQTYHALKARHEDLTGDEKEELERLRRELRDNFVVGDTLVEQAVGEAYSKAAEESAKAVPEKLVVRPDRRQLIDSVLDQLKEIEGAGE